MILQNPLSLALVLTGVLGRAGGVALCARGTHGNRVTAPGNAVSDTTPENWSVHGQ